MDGRIMDGRIDENGFFREEGELFKQMAEHQGLTVEQQKALFDALDPTSTVGVYEKLLKPLNLRYVEYNVINVFSILYRLNNAEHYLL